MVYISLIWIIKCKVIYVHMLTSVRVYIRIVDQYQSRPLPCRSLTDLGTLEDAWISPKSRTHLKILGSKMVTHWEHTHTHTHIYIYMCIYMHIYTHEFHPNLGPIWKFLARKWSYINTHTHTHIYIYICVCVCVCSQCVTIFEPRIYIYIYIYISDATGWNAIDRTIRCSGLVYRCAKQSPPYVIRFVNKKRFWALGKGRAEENIWICTEEKC